MAPAPPAPSALLRAENLALSRGGRVLFEALNIGLAAGDVLVVEGPNGAGKSSLLLTLAGVLRPTAGRIVVDENMIHVVGHEAGVKSRLTVNENLRFWRDLYGADGIEVGAALAAVGLGDLAELEAGVLSAGQKRRLGLARLLVSRRPVWLLDEPTASLDPAGKELVGRMIDAHVAGAGAVLVTTHEPRALSAASRSLRLGGTA